MHVCLYVYGNAGMHMCMHAYVHTSHKNVQSSVFACAPASGYMFCVYTAILVSVCAHRPGMMPEVPIEINSRLFSLH